MLLTPRLSFPAQPSLSLPRLSLPSRPSLSFPRLSLPSRPSLLLLRLSLHRCNRSSRSTARVSLRLRCMGNILRSTSLYLRLRLSNFGSNQKTLVVLVVGWGSCFGHWWCSAMSLTHASYSLQGHFGHHQPGHRHDVFWTALVYCFLGCHLDNLRKLKPQPWLEKYSNAWY